MSFDVSKDVRNINVMESNIHKSKIHNNRKKKKALKENLFRDLQHVFKPIECKNKTLARHFTIPILKMKLIH